MEHGMGQGSQESSQATRGSQADTAFRADDRLVKTLLLAALVPQVESLKGLNSARLAALNHGSITAPIPGREKQEVLRRVRNWAAQVGEIKVGEEADPTVTLHLSGVDTEGILANAQAVDNPGNRRRKVREILFEQIGIEDRDDLFLEHEILWRGTRRSFQIIFGNVRELTLESLAAKGGGRKVVMDFPFDEPGHSPAEDQARLDDFRAEGKPARTLVWLPAFLSIQAQRDLGTLVKLDDILKNDDTFRRYASHLAAIDQAQARELLRNQRSSLRQRLIRYLEGTYGVDSPVPGSVDEACSPDTHYHSLDPSFTPQAPVGANLQQALHHLLSQMLESQFPAHPRFGVEEIKIGLLRKVQAEVERAAQAPDGRIAVDRALRHLMSQIAVPLKLGEMGETHFALGRHWYSHFGKQVQGQITVARLRAALDDPTPMGLPSHAQNLVILVYADQANRSFYLHGGPYQPKLEDLPDELELREQALPSQTDWDLAIQRAGKVFGITVSPLRNATNVSDLAAKLKEAAGKAVEGCQVVKDRLDGLCGDWGLDAVACPRCRTADAVLTLVRELGADEDPKRRVELLAQAGVQTSLDAMGTSFTKATVVRTAIDGTKWALFEGVAALVDERKPAADGIVTQLKEALTHDEYAIALQSRLAKLEGDAIRLLTPKPAPTSKPGQQPGQTTPTQGRKIVKSDSKVGLSATDGAALLAGLQTSLAADPALKVDLTWTLYKEQGKE